MNVLVACEFSGIVRDAFRARGHNAWSCDLLETETPDKRWHMQTNVLDILDRDWDLMIAHPSCTYMTNSGVCHLHKDAKRWLKLWDAADFFLQLWNAPIPKKCIENPIMHRYAKRLIGVQQSQIIQPWMFGHMEQKATCLWLEGLPLLTPTDNVKEEMLTLPDNRRQRLHYLSPGPDRWKNRSRTFPGIAQAMAETWG